MQAVVEEPELLVRDQVLVPGSRTEFYEMVRIHDYWFEDGTWLTQNGGVVTAGFDDSDDPSTVRSC